MSVMTTPSIVHTASRGLVPFDWKFDCWPVSFPPMFTRSTSTPGTVRRSAHGSRDVGIISSSFWLKLVAVPIALVSTIGDSPDTVTVSWTDATLMVIGRSTLWPTATTMPSRMKVVKPSSSASSRYNPGGRFRNRNLPRPSVTNVSVRSALVSVTVTPGSTPPCSSTTVPAIVPLCTWAVADPATARHSASVKNSFLMTRNLPDNCVWSLTLPSGLSYEQGACRRARGAPVEIRPVSRGGDAPLTARFGRMDRRRVDA